MFEIKSLTDKTYIIAEIGQAHEGSLGIAHSYIDAVSKSGVDCIKFQTHFADHESSSKDTFRVKRKYQQDVDRKAYWKRMEFKNEEWVGLKEHCDNNKIDFLSTPFSEKAFEMLDNLNIDFWKIASGEVTNFPMIEKIAKTNKPILVSSGLSSFEELDDTVNLIRGYHNNICLLQCTSSYPCPPDQYGLNLIDEMRKRYDVPIGLSDHSGSIYPSIAAITLGARIIEVHVTFDKEMFGYDASSSLTISELSELVKGIRLIENIISNPVDKNRLTEEQINNKKLFEKSIFVSKDMKVGDIIKSNNLEYKKPGDGILSKNINKILGKRVRKNILAGQMLKESDLND